MTGGRCGVGGWEDIAATVMEDVMVIGFRLYFLTASVVGTWLCIYSGDMVAVL